MIKLMHPIMRFEGWEPSGLFRRKPDTRTVEEIKGSIEAWARRVSEVKPILPELKTMNPKHLGLVADTIELSQKPATSYIDVDMMKVDEDFGPFNPLEKLMAVFPFVSKKNPHAMTFSQEVIDATGKLMSKFYLKAAADTDFLMDEGVDKNFEKGVASVEHLAKEALKTFQVDKFTRQEEFVGSVLALIDKNSDPKKIELLDDVYNTLKNGGIYEFDFEELIKNKVSENTVKENLKTLKESLGVTYAYGKILNVNEYLVKYPEDARIPFRNLNDNKLYRISGADLIDRFRRRN